MSADRRPGATVLVTGVAVVRVFLPALALGPWARGLAGCIAPGPPWLTACMDRAGGSTRNPYGPWPRLTLAGLVLLPRLEGR